MPFDIKSRFKILFAVLFGIILLGAVSFWFLEELSFVDSLYFSIVTITTVGYGDIHPVTPMGKTLAVVLIVTGGIVFLAVVANATEFIVNKREREIRMQKLNIVIGVFISELGSDLLAMLVPQDRNLSTIQSALRVNASWDDKMFARSHRLLASYQSDLTLQTHHLHQLSQMLADKNDLLLQLLLNANLLEHEMFTDLIQATSHLKEELINRIDLDASPQSDISHLANDVTRAYQILVRQWLDHVKHLKNDYPYLFSFAVRTNPFDKDAVITV